MKPPLRIAILECDTPIENIREKYGGYGAVFTALLKAGADALKEPEILSSTKGLELSTWDVVTAQKYPSMENIDAILITGSRFNSFDNDPWILKLVDFTKQILNQERIRIVGVCFGHQIVGRAMGVRVDRSDKGWEVAVTSVKLTDMGRQLFRKDVLNIHQMHRDIVCTYPPEVELLGYTPRCEVQGMYIRNRLITVQGHPEFNEEIVRELLEVRHGQRIFDYETFEDAIRRVGNAQDGVLVAQAFLRFLLDD